MSKSFGANVGSRGQFHWNCERPWDGAEVDAVVRFSMPRTAKDLLSRVETWPEEDREELLEMARAIEARRSGIYFLSEDEQVAIDAARRSPIASDEKVRAFWERFGIA